MHIQKISGLDGYHLKLIAAGCMLLDHVAVVLLYPLQRAGAAGAEVWAQVLRIIGRTAFPLYCYLLVQGFLHTGNIRRYLARLLLAGILSEIPFDLAFHGTVLEFRSNNVFFTLFLGLLLIWGMQEMEKRRKNSVIGETLYLVFACLLCGAVWFAAEKLLQSDYGGPGTAAILSFYLFRKNPGLGALLAVAVLSAGNLTELWALPAAVLAACSTGKRGKNAKWGFYLFYPAHLLLLAAVRAIVF